MNVASAAEKGGTLTKQAYQNLVSGEVILGGKNAKVTIIEYSDMECPFCIRHHRETFPLIQKNFQKSVNFIWKNNRGVNHDGTEKKAIAALCVKKVAPSKYYTVIHEILSKSNEKKWTLYDTKKLTVNLSKFVPVKKLTEFQSCIKEQKTKKEFEQETKEAESYNLLGTPGFILIHNTTRKYTIIEWAYPYNTFKEAIQKLLKN